MMRDCPDGSMRDQLPLWVHGALSASDAAAVAAHVATCDDCAREAELLRRVAAALPEPAIDAGRIAAAIPTAREVRGRATRRLRWRMAAAASFLLVASVSMLTLRGIPRDGESSVTDGVLVRAEPAMPMVVATESVPVSLDATAGATLPGFSGVGELSDAQLRVLLADLQHVEALPSAEPDVEHHGFVNDTTQENE